MNVLLPVAEVYNHNLPKNYQEQIFFI